MEEADEIPTEDENDEDEEASDDDDAASKDAGKENGGGAAAEDDEIGETGDVARTNEGVDGDDTANVGGGINGGGVTLGRPVARTRGFGFPVRVVLAAGIVEALPMGGALIAGAGASSFGIRGTMLGNLCKGFSIIATGGQIGSDERGEYAFVSVFGSLFSGTAGTGAAATSSSPQKNPSSSSAAKFIVNVSAS